jgi:hypothetical protein
MKKEVCVIKGHTLNHEIRNPSILKYNPEELYLTILKIMF